MQKITKKVGKERKLIVFEVLVVRSNTASNKESNLGKHLFCPTVNIFYIYALPFSAISCRITSGFKSNTKMLPPY